MARQGVGRDGHDIEAAQAWASCGLPATYIMAARAMRSRWRGASDSTAVRGVGPRLHFDEAEDAARRARDKIDLAGMVRTRRPRMR